PLGPDRLAYLVMEYLGGCTLSEILAEETNLEINWVVDILEQACSAIDAAHRQGIIHRDLKPDNIWLEPNRRGGYTVKVLDFGLAKLGDALLPEEDAGERPAPQSLPRQHTPVERADGRTQAIERHLTQPGAADFETATRMRIAHGIEEQQTRILAQNPTETAPKTEAGKQRESSEAAAALGAVAQREEEQTQLLEQRPQNTPVNDGDTKQNRVASQPSSDDGL